MSHRLIVVCSLLVVLWQGSVLTWAEDNRQKELSLYVESGIRHSARSVAFAYDDRLIATGSLDRTIKIWDAHSSRELMTLPNDKMSSFLIFLPGRPALASANEDGTITVWDIATEALLTSVMCAHSGSPIAVANSGATLICADEVGKTVRRWNTVTFEQLPSIPIQTKEKLTSLHLSTDGALMAGRNSQGHFEIISLSAWKVIGQLPTTNSDSISFAYDSGKVVTNEEHTSMTVWQWDRSTDRPAHVERTIEAPGVHASCFSHDGQRVAYASESGDIVILETSKWKEVTRLQSYSNRIENVGLAKDSRELAAQAWYDSHFNWNLEKGALVTDSDTVITYDNNHTFEKRGTLFGQGFRVSNQEDSIRLERENGEEILTLVLLDKIKSWVAVAPDGRFDTNMDLADIAGVHWVLSGKSLDPLPLEIFMRDYYEPRLLPRILAGETLPPIRSLATLNRAQPTVEILNIERESAAGTSGDTVAVTIEVSGASQEFGLDDEKRRMATAAYDLRLFRDGQLVGQWPQQDIRASPVGMSADDELKKWRQERRVVDLREGTRQLVFKGIRLPRRDGIKDVQFSAYAFNEDRVKSKTARKLFTISEDITPRAPRAYIVTVGVNAFEDDRWDLSYAANDATQLGTALMTRLQAQRDEQGQPRYEDVVWVGLTAEAQTDNGGKRHLTKTHARKAKIEAVLKVLAGQPINTEVLKGIANVDLLRRANPEDLVILALSTHGEVDQRGQFYLLPHDIGANPTESERRTRAISNDDLSAWLQGLDAIDLVLIVDACHSAASVQSTDFKPGPMGSRGLGQLAYDKGMRILTATQIDQYALETQKTQLGLLSYALVREGLEQAKADYRPKDQRIWLSEWLNYASERVPGLYQDWKAGTLKGRKKGEFLDAPEAYPGETPALQQPALFDFSRNRDALIGTTVK